jgi:hypothetical protein
MAKNIPNYRKIFQMTITYTSIFHSKIYANWYFWFENKSSGNPGSEPPLVWTRLFSVVAFLEGKNVEKIK